MYLYNRCSKSSGNFPIQRLCLNFVCKVQSATVRETSPPVPWQTAAKKKVSTITKSRSPFSSSASAFSRNKKEALSASPRPPHSPHNRFSKRCLTPYNVVQSPLVNIAASLSGQPKSLSFPLVRGTHIDSDPCMSALENDETISTTFLATNLRVPPINFHYHKKNWSQVSTLTLFTNNVVGSKLRRAMM